MRAVAFAVLATLVLSGCKLSPGCLASKAVSKPLAGFIVSTAACKKPANVERDVLAFCNNSLGLCKDPQPTGPIGTVVCPLIGMYAKPKLAPLIESKLKADWECDPNVAAATIVDGLVAGCELLFPVDGPTP